MSKSVATSSRLELSTEFFNSLLDCRAGMGVTWKFEIGIPRSQFALANQAAGWAVEEEPDNQGSEASEGSALAVENSHGYDLNARAYLKRWSPQDATVEVWSQRGSDKSSIIDLSLRENLVHFRVDTDRAGARKYFVLREDEARVREILRQIEKGEPPQ